MILRRNSRFNLARCLPKLAGLIAGALLADPAPAGAQNAINVTLSTSTVAGSTTTINPPSGSVTYGAANIYDSGTLWNQVRYPNSGERIPTGSLNGGAAGTFPLTFAQNLSLLDSSGNATAAQLSIAINIGDVESGSSTRFEPNAGAGGSPAQLMGGAWRIYRGGNSMTFTVAGLAAGKEYDLYAYGSAASAGQGCVFTLAAANVSGGNPGSVTSAGGNSGNIFDAGFSPLAAQGVTWDVLHAVSDGSGTIVFSTSKNSSNGQFMNGFQLQPICEAATINSSPTNLTTSVGAGAAFAVSATGTGLTYQWRKNGAALANAGSVSGVNTPTLTINPVAIADIALSPGYDCLVGNAGGCSVLSGAATLSVYSATMFATPSLPASGATGVCADAVLELTFDRPPTLNNSGFIRIYDAANTNAPADQIDLSQNVNGAQSRSVGGDSFKAYPVLIAGNTATIFPNPGRLAANKTYFVTLDPGTFSDSTGALFGGLTNTAAWRFTTKAAGPASATNLVVAADGSGDFCTVQGALDFLPANNSQPVLINIRRGQYLEIVDVNNKHHITFRGEDRALSQVGYPNNNNLNPGAPWRAAFVVNGDDCAVENLTITNTTPKGGSQAEALDVEGTRFIAYNMNLASYQDTFLIHSSGKLVCFQDSLIQGDTDFAWGYGTVFFTNCEIRCLSSGGHVTQPRSPLGSNGFAFVNCTVTKGFASGTFDLGRSISTPTTPSESIFANCRMDDAVTGYASDAGSNFWTFANSNLTATVARTSLANATELPASSPVVTNARRAALWLYGWVPQLAPNILSHPAPQSVYSGATATFGVAATGMPSPVYQWRKNGANISSATNSTLAITNAQVADLGGYSVVVANAAGSVTSSVAPLLLLNYVPPLPVIPGGTTNILSFGAVGNGVATNTAAIQNAINALSASPAHGGTVEIPPGVYLSGPITLANNINLQIDAGATLMMLPYGSYPGGASPTDFISASKLHDISITGFGTIEGQGAPWWAAYEASGIARPKAMFAPSTCTNVLVENVTLQSPPNTHISLRNLCKNVTIQAITINTTSDVLSDNTDGIDVNATNCLILNCSINCGDDHVALGGDSGGVTILNTAFGNGHGISIGSHTDGGLRNILVDNSSMTIADGASLSSGIRMKSGRDRGGFARNLTYLNLGLTNVQNPIFISSYYPDSTIPSNPTTDTGSAITATTPIWRDISISNVNVVASSGRNAGRIYGLPEMLITNLTLSEVTVQADLSFVLYHVRNAVFVDSQINVPGSVNTFSLYNVDLTVTNSVFNPSLVKIGGWSSDLITNRLAFFNTRAAFTDTNVLGDTAAITLGGSTLTVSNDWNMDPALVLNFTLGASNATIAASSNLTLKGTINVSAGDGFTNGTYTLFTCGKSLTWGAPVLGSTPTGYSYALDTNTAGQVNLTVTPLAPAAPANLTAQGTNLLINLRWSASPNADGYNLKRSTTNGGPYATIASVPASNYSDAAVSPGVTYYYVVTATNSASESPESNQAGAVPLPSLTATNVDIQMSGGGLQLAWPADHIGWQLQAQTNALADGLGTNWVEVPGSAGTNRVFLPIDSANGSVFLQLVYP